MHSWKHHRVNLNLESQNDQECSRLINPFRKPCLDKVPDVSNFKTPESTLKNVTLLPCSCSRGTTECPAGAEGPLPPKVQV